MLRDVSLCEKPLLLNWFWSENAPVFFSFYHKTEPEMTSKQEASFPISNFFFFFLQIAQLMKWYYLLFAWDQNQDCIAYLFLHLLLGSMELWVKWHIDNVHDA